MALMFNTVCQLIATDASFERLDTYLTGIAGDNTLRYMRVLARVLEMAMQEE